jgi:7-cyano-7-deazaguanine reductase
MTKPLSQSDHLGALGSENTVYTYEGADANLLEAFPNPMSAYPGAMVKIVSEEFTSLCPKTGQPDFATIVVEYQPRDICVESKSYKLYLGSFRNVGEFHEACVARITTDLIELLDPLYLLVRGEFTPRGGIPFWPEIVYHGDDA